MMQPDDLDRLEEELIAPARREFDALRARHREDLPPALVRAADADALPEGMQEAVSRHAARDPWQRALVAGFNDADTKLEPHDEDRLLARLHADIARDAPARVVRVPWRWRPIVSLAAAAVIAAALFIRLRAPVTPVPAVAVDAPVASVPAAPAAPAFILPLEAPDVQLTPKALVRRSTGKDAKFLDDVAPAFAAYRAGKYDEAAREFARVAPQYKDSVEIPFYLGVSQLLGAKPVDAVSSLESARRVGDDTFNAQIARYLAVAEERAGNRAGARVELDGLCKGTSSFAARACDAASRIKD